MNKDLSIIFPIFNEFKSLEYVVRTWDDYLKEKLI